MSILITMRNRRNLKRMERRIAKDAKAMAPWLTSWVEWYKSQGVDLQTDTDEHKRFMDIIKYGEEISSDRSK